ncbi:alpha-galactosidase [Vallitalea okinawensis]|uniref:alpha-galactosidase n=1 Tax=Vallitalea okinawensis TaxID=2078660 RepID=UPI000CFBD4B8|nr:alpha-galactosidase [Vallitalea okinawensis]
MAIYYNQEQRTFHLQNDKISYIMSIMRNGQLGHLYFGKRVNDNNHFTRMHVMAKRGFTCYAYEGDTTFSLDLMRQEYPSYGTTDFREPAFQISQENGSRITDFKYKSHRIYSGKPELTDLPATYVESPEEAETLEIHLLDDVINCKIILYYSIFKDYAAIARSAQFINHSHEELNLTRALSMSIDLPDSDYDMVYLAGKWTRECHLKKRPLNAGLQGISSSRGASSSIQNPFFALAREKTDENVGEVYGFSFVYSGNFLGQVEVNFDDEARVSMGINPFDFNWLLTSSESFQTPEVVLTYSDRGFNGMSQTYHSLYRNRLVKSSWRDQVRPILINNWEATYFDFTESQILKLAQEAKDLGIELFVLDDGWFGQRHDNTSSLGDWFPNKEKLPHGIKGLAEKIEDLGLKFGLWFEPEMISKKSILFEKHPDWRIQVINRPLSHGRNQYILDFTREEVVNYVFDMMAQILDDAPVSYVKWDMNRFMTEVGSLALPPKRQGEVAHRYILGVYRLYRKLSHAFPNILFESCASGGGRFDPGMLYHAPQTWTSDDTDAIERTMIQYGTSYVYPLSSMGSHVSAVPNHQVGRMTPLSTRGNVAYFGTFGYELDVTSMTDEEKEEVKEQIAFFKENRLLIRQGLFYRMDNPFDKKRNFTSWMVVSEDQKEALVGYYYLLAQPDTRYDILNLTGLDTDQLYRIEGMDGEYFGDELMQIGVIIHGKKDFHSGLLRLKAIDK